MRNFLLALLLLLAFYFFFSRFAEIESVVDTLQRGDWRWLSLAILLSVAGMVNIASLLRAIYRMLKMEETIQRLFILGASAFFVNVIAPAAGMSGMAVIVSDARVRGHPPGRVTTAVALYTLYDYLAFLIVLGLGLSVLVRRNQLGIGELAASAILVVIAGSIGFLLFLGMRSSAKLGNVLAWMARNINHLMRPFLHRDYLHEERAHEFAHDISEGLNEVRKSTAGLILPLALALSRQAINIAILFMVFVAFKQPFSAGTLVAGYAIGYLFLIVSPTPSGIGFVEGAMTLALTTLRVPLEAAAVITLAYRGITLWLPLLYGLIAFRWIGSHPSAAPGN
jgi:uncharacterized protein (TIRG00374 family)